MNRTIRVLVIVVCSGVGAFLVLNYWIFWGRSQYASATTRIVDSGFARFLRCRGVARPKLARIPGDWQFRYSWVGGYGPGDVWIDVRANGAVTVRSKPNAGPAILSYHQLTAAQIRQLADVVDNTGLLCLSSVRRKGYFVNDLGRYSFTVEAPNYAKTVYIDGCNTVDDTRAFQRVGEQITRLKSVLGEPVTWGPFGMSTSSSTGHCGVR